MPIIEVMTNSLETGSVEFGSFTVDNTNTTVDLIDNINNDAGSLVGANNDDLWFSQGDNFNLLSLGINMPLNYEVTGINGVVGLIPCRLHGRDFSGNQAIFYNGYLPFSSYELAIGQYIDVTSANFNSKFRLFLSYLPNPGFNNQISMIGVPDSENQKGYQISSFIKIQHNTELTQNPI